jgi:hypothetical protein
MNLARYGALTFVLVLARATSVSAADFDDVVLLANEDHFAGNNDVWGFVGTNGREYVI